VTGISPLASCFLLEHRANCQDHDVGVVGCWWRCAQPDAETVGLVVGEIAAVALTFVIP
jgi:hypothetical protein